MLNWIPSLEAVSSAAEDAVISAGQLAELHERNLGRLPRSNRSRDTVRELFTYLEQHPIIDVRHTAEALGLSFNTASAAIKKLIETGILKETRNVSRNRVFAYEEYLGILRKDT